MKCKSVAAATVRRLGFTGGILALMMGPMHWYSPLHGEVDPSLVVTITRTNQDVVLQWLGSNAMAYQVESRSNLTAWTTASLVVTGSGSFVFFTNPMTEGSDSFFRIKRLVS